MAIYPYHGVMFSAPALMATFTEPARLGVELWALGVFAAPITFFAPAGDGRPVLVLPGFGANDATTLPLRKFLDIKGYDSRGWENGINTGPSERTLACLKERLDDIFNRAGGRKVALVGHSLGGIYARELARAFPDKTDRVITLGAPFGLSVNPQGSLKIVQAVFNMLNPDSVAAHEPTLIKNLLMPPPVPTTSVYSRYDGVVHCSASFNPDTALSENIEIGLYASHIGFTSNPASLALVAQRLAEPREEWKKFNVRNEPVFWAHVPGQQAHHGHMPALPEFSEDERVHVNALAPNLGLRLAA